ncbi:beta strand repeat-containing protein [Deinococcus sp. UYEF24]
MTRTRLTLLTALIASAALSSTGAAGTAANTSISNTGIFTYQDDGGTTQSVSSTPVTITVAQVGGISITANGTVGTPGQTIYVTPGNTGALTYTVTNTGNGADTVTLTTQDGAGNPVTGVTYYYDAALTQPVTGNAVPLAADQSRTVYAAYTVPAGATGGAGVYVTPVGTSSFNGSVVDNNNVGLISPTRVHSVTVSTDNALTATTPGGAVGAHTLTNTGNTPIASGDLTVTGTVNDTNGILASVSYQFSSGATSGAASANPTTALNNYLTAAGPLAAGASVTLSTTYTAAAGKAIGQSANDAVKGYFVATSTASDTYGTTSANATVGTDTLTLVGGVANVSKVADNCGTDATCMTPVLNTTTGKPGDYIRYTIKVMNSGSSALKRPVVQDTLNTNLLYVKSTGTTTQAGAGVQAVYSTDNTAYSAAAPVTLASGGTLYVGLNTTGGSVKPTGADTLMAGESFSVVILTQIK